MNYDVFISYRRDKGAMIARNLQQALSALGLKVFFDMEELTDGKFNEKLYDSIEQSKNVIFLMTEGSLTRCLNDGDWVRNELEHVIDKGVNLIPIAPTGTPIEFPEGLPEKLAPLKVLEISELNLEKLFKESVAKIAGRLKDVVLTSDKEKKEAEEAFLSQARRFKGNDGVIDQDEMKELLETAKELGISTARRIKLIEQIEQEYVPSSAASLDAMPATTDVVHSFDVFISYRRVGGSKDAWQMHEQLSKLGYSVCYDMDMLKDGNFNEELLRRVAECKNFVVLLSNGCFDQTLDPKSKRDEDRLRIELATAFYNKKNVVAVKLPGFVMPAQLPPDIDAVRDEKIGLKYDKYHIDSFYDGMKKRLISSDEAKGAGADHSESIDILSVDATARVRDTSLDDLFGDDAASWREEAEVSYRSVSRILPYAELRRLDDAWLSAEENLKNGDHQAATRCYIDVASIARSVESCASPFATRLIGDGVDTHSSSWFEQVLKKAQAGDVDYQYGIGTLYFDGLGVEKNAAAAFRWFSRAAGQGHIQAIAAVGSAYASGTGVEIDYRAAKKNLVIAEKQGDMRAVERLAYLYENGFGVRRNYAVAVSKYKKAAMSGNTAAMVALGRMLEEGSGIDRDVEKSVSWYRLAVASGNAVAQRKMASFLFSGKYVEKDEVEAVKLARMSANQGDADAIAILGRAYEDGTGIDSDPAKALELYKKAIDAGSALGKLYFSELEPDDQYRNGVKFLEGSTAAQDFVLAKRWFEKAAAQNYVPAMEQLGFMNERGLGCEVNIQIAKEWYEKASEKGNAAAMVGLGKMYFRGSDGIEKDYKKSVEYFKKAAALWQITEPENQWKVFYAFFYLGRIYIEGLGVEKDLWQGQRCHLFAANHGNIASTHSIAVDYEKGTDGKIKSPEQSKLWYGKCAHFIKEGKIRFADDMAMRVVGMLYNWGDGVAKDLEVSREWYLRAAKMGNLQCLKSMGQAYLNGRGVPKDVVKAIEFLEAAGNRGDDDTQEDLGWLYYQGEKIEKSYEKALYWFQKAAALGSGYAMEKLSRMYRDGSGVEQSDQESMKWLTMAAEKENAFAMAELGHCLEFGERGKDIDVVKAVDLYKKASEKKSIRAKFEYGRCLQSGIGCEVNKEEAFKQLGVAMTSGKDASNYYQNATQAVAEIYFGTGAFEAAEHWANAVDPELNRKVLHRLAWRFRAGDGVDQNIANAVLCFKAAAEHGDKNAQNSLGWMYYEGRYVDRNSKLAFEWTMKAVQNGDPNGMETLFRMYRDGDGVEKNEAEAMKWLHRSAEGEEFSSEAVSWLGECYEFGTMGEAKDEKRAYQCYYKASQKRNTHAMYNRGRCYLSGIGVEKDATKALEWLSKAAEEDDNDLFYDEWAMAKLVDIYSHGDAVPTDVIKAQEWQKKLDDLKAKRVEEIRGYVSPV